MKIYLTGIGGLIGSTVAEVAHQRGHDVVGVDNDSRGVWFGPEASVEWRLEELRAINLRSLGLSVIPANFRNRPDLIKGADLIVHCASQPSHDFSRSNVLEDSAVNYMGTVELLEMTRQMAPKAIFVFLSTNKVYGDWVNRLDFRRNGLRYMPDFPLDGSLGVSEAGINETFPIDMSLHTPFGVSKLAADMMVQEYRYCFGLKTVCFRCGCLTGKGGTAVELQGFLGYMVKCAVEGKPYTIYGHQGYQVRDSIDAADVADAILRYAEDPKGAVYNMGGGFENSVSINEVIDYLWTVKELRFPTEQGPERLGDHKFWITDTTRFECDYPGWTRRNIWEVLDEMVRCELGRRGTSKRDAALSPGAHQT